MPFKPTPRPPWWMPPPTLSDLLRKAIVESGRSAADLTDGRGGPVAALRRWLREDGGLHITTAERVIANLELRIVLLPIDAPDPAPAAGPAVPVGGESAEEDAAGPEGGRWG